MKGDVHDQLSVSTAACTIASGPPPEGDVVPPVDHAMENFHLLVDNGLSRVGPMPRQVYCHHDLCAMPSSTPAMQTSQEALSQS
eukprot:11008678-Karenia_brevis.AAC.1